MISNRRRFERVPLDLDWGAAHAILGAEWHWKNHESGKLFDLSYQGMAAAQPALGKLTVGESVNGELVLGGSTPMPLLARVAWLKGAIAGLEFKDVRLQSRQVIEKFLKDQLVGRHLRRIDPKFYQDKADFTAWYHGPGDTNVYLWQESGIVRAEIELGGRALRFDRGEITPGNDPELIKRVMFLLSQIGEPHQTVKTVMESLAKAAK